MTTYTTVSGDTWDFIAFNIYGDGMYTELLMGSNQVQALLETVIFDSGIILNVPDLPELTDTSTELPPWRL